LAPSLHCITAEATTRRTTSYFVIEEESVLNIHVENIGAMSVVECEGRIVRSDAAFYLRDAVISQSDADIIVVDLSEVTTVEGGGLGMLLYLHRWAFDHNLRLKLFNPSDQVRSALMRAGSVSKPDIASLDEVMALLWRYQSPQAMPAMA
jgi:anti-anti-sigma regulatory factor